jgi:DNA-binding FadR family transcriptional regulator
VKASLAIAAEFRQRIARGELREGDPLPVESELTEQLGVSKGVVREALRILETEGLIVVRRGLGGGPRVCHPSISETAKAMGVYLQIGDVLVMDVFEARDRIIGGAVERLAGAPGDVDVSALEASVSELVAIVGDFDTYYPQLIEVGETAVRLAGNTTEYVLVVALRHIIAAELEAATRAIVDVGLAMAIEEEVSRSWAESSRHIKAGRAAAARRAYARQAELVRSGLATKTQGATVVDIFSEAWQANLSPVSGSTG